jgi:TPP-dependent pyruvate/acetoin dehydrogenase alpha subunit
MFEKKLIDDGHMASHEQEAMKEEVIAEVAEAEAFGKQSAFPEFRDLPITPGVAL